MTAKPKGKSAKAKGDDRRGGARAGAGRPPKDRPPAPAAPHLEEAIRSARTVKALQSVLAEIGAGVASGKIDRLLGETLEAIIARAEKLLKARRAERTLSKLRSIEILLPDEVELLQAHRARLAGAPLAPGVPVAGPPAPPPGALERIGIAPAAPPANQAEGP